MPRLRRIKDYEVDWDVASDVASDAASDIPHDSQESNENRQNIYEESSEGSRASGESWLSNASIVAVLSDEKLRSAINYHRQMAKLLEAEFAGRQLGTHTRRRVRDFDSASVQQDSHQNSRVRRTSGRLNKTVKAIAQALQAGLSLEEIHRLLTQMKED